MAQNKATVDLTEGKNNFTKRIVFSNTLPIGPDLRPKKSGGVQEIIEASNPRYWMGPMAVSDAVWEKMSEEERATPVVYYTGKDVPYDVIGVPVPESVLKKMHYNDISNGIFWPVAHSRQPDIQLPLESLDRSYFEGYTKFSQIMAMAIQKVENGTTLAYHSDTVLEGAPKTVDIERLQPRDSVWVHDYQCANVPENLYSWHIPWPGPEYPHATMLQSFQLLDSEVNGNRAQEADRLQALWLAQKDEAKVEEVTEKQLRLLVGKRADRLALRDDQAVKRVTLKDEDGKPLSFALRDIPLRETPMFRDYVESLSSHPLFTMQRPIDQANYIMTLADLDNGFNTRAGASSRGRMRRRPDFITANAELFAEGEAELLRRGKMEDKIAVRDALVKRLQIGDVVDIIAFGETQSTLNVPVGQDARETEKEANENYQRLDKTVFYRHPEKDDLEYPSKLKEMENRRRDLFEAVTGKDDKGITYHHGANFTGLNPDDYTIVAPRVADIVKPLAGRKWVFSGHRNDYTKGTDEKLAAWEKLLNEHPERAKDSTLLLVLQPTRVGVPGYLEYAQEVFEKAQAIREKFGDKSVVIIPQGIDHGDILGLMRRDEARVQLNISPKDGHDLTAREFVDSNPFGSAKMVICSDGIGARDVLAFEGKGRNGQIQQRGALVANKPDAVAEALAFALDSNNDRELKQRFNDMKTRSQQYDIDYFSSECVKAHLHAMEWQHGPKWADSDRPRELNNTFTDMLGKTRPVLGKEFDQKSWQRATLANPDSEESKLNCGPRR